MAAKNLGLFFLILGTTGISVVSTVSFPRNEMYPDRLSGFNNMQLLRRIPEAVQTETKFCERFRRFHNHPHPLCGNAYNSFRFRPDTYYKQRVVYPETQKPYSRNDWFKKYVVEEPHNSLIIDLYDSSENSISATHRSSTIERDAINKQNLFNYIQTTSSSDKLKNPSMSDTYSKSIISHHSPATTNNEFDSHMTGQKISDFTILTEYNKGTPLIQTTSNPHFSQTLFKTTIKPQRKSPSVLIKGNVEMNKNKNLFATTENSNENSTIKSSAEAGTIENSTKLFTDAYTKRELQNFYINKSEDPLEGIASSRSNSITLYSETPETKDNYVSKEDNIHVKTTAFQKITSVISSEATRLKDESKSSATTETAVEKFFEMLTHSDEKSVFSVDIQQTTNKYSESESTRFQTSSFSSIDEDISIRTESSSSENISSKNTEYYRTESTTTPNSPIVTNDEATMEYKLSSPTETKSTTAKVLQTKSTAEKFVPSVKATSIKFPNKITEDITKQTASTKASLKIEFPPGDIPQDHVIEISSIRTARIVITSMFLVIALIAITVLAVYIFRLRRREVEYDQLMLIS